MALMLKTLIQRRRIEEVGSMALYASFKYYKEARLNQNAFSMHCELTGTTTFDAFFLNMGGEKCLLRFRFRRKDITKFVKVIIVWTNVYRKRRNL